MGPMVYLSKNIKAEKRRSQLQYIVHGRRITGLAYDPKHPQNGPDNHRKEKQHAVRGRGHPDREASQTTRAGQEPCDLDPSEPVTREPDQGASYRGSQIQDGTDGRSLRR